MGFSSLSEDTRQFQRRVKTENRAAAQNKERHRQLVYAAADAVYLAVFEGRREDADRALAELRALVGERVSSAA